MKKRTIPFKMGVFAYLLFLPIFLLTNCQNEFDEPVLSSQTDVNRDLEVLLLMKAAIVSDSDYASLNKESASKSTDPASSDQCTQFQYPMTFEVYSGDNPNPELYEINSDEELVAFVDMLVASQNNFQYYIYFPITLLDTDGNKTVLNDLEELEGTLNMAVEACEGMNSDSPDGGTGADGGTGTDGGSGTDGGTGTDEGSTGTTSGTTSSDGSGESTGSDTGSESTGSDGGSDSGTGTDNSGDGSSGGDGSNGGDGSGDDSSDDGDDSGDDSGDDDNDNGDDGDDFVEVSESDDNGYQYCDKKAKKVVICHKGVTICISVNAIWGHMQHHEEDYFGRCED